MSYRFHGRARVDPSNPQAFGACDRCGFLYNLADLGYQFQWAGTELVNKRIRVCETCMDEPSMFLKTGILPPDPLPVIDARPEPYAIDQVDYRVTEEENDRINESDVDRVIESSADQDYGS